MVLFGQIVVGPPGSGKTTFCRGMKMFIESLGRKCEIVNLDFANDILPYEPAIDVRELVSIEKVMDELVLGPNGGLIYCMEYLVDHLDWLEDALMNVGSSYVLFDCPGQIELYTHHTGMQFIIQSLQKSLDLRLCSVHLLDAHYCCTPTTFLSATLLIASTMLRLGLPHVNVLSKVDLLNQYGSLPFTLDFYTEMTDLMPLVNYVETGFPIPEEADGPIIRRDDIEDDETDGDMADRPDTEPPTSVQKTLGQKHRKMTEGLCEFLTDFGLVSFIPLSVEDAETMGRVLAKIDRANGFSFASSEANEILQRQSEGKDPLALNILFRQASGGAGAGSALDLEPTYMRSLDILERFTPNDGGGGTV